MAIDSRYTKDIRTELRFAKVYECKAMYGEVPKPYMTHLKTLSIKVVEASV